MTSLINESTDGKITYQLNRTFDGIILSLRLVNGIRVHVALLDVFITAPSHNPTLPHSSSVFRQLTITHLIRKCVIAEERVQAQEHARP